MASRLMPQNLFSELWPDRKDPNAGRGKYLCRFCGKPAVKPKHYYCSDHCHDMCQLSVNWLSARRAAYFKDGQKCVYCSIQLKLYVGDNRPGRHVAACHHKFPVKKIFRLCWDLIKEWGLYDYDRDDVEARKKMNHTFSVLYTLLYLDVNNLFTYCPEHHKLIHAADNRSRWSPNYYVPRTYWANFWDMAHREHYTKKLTDWF